MTPCTCNCHATCDPVKGYNLTAGHVGALRKLLLAVRYYGKNDVHIRDQMKRARGTTFQLSDDEWTNFSHLRYHGLAHHADKEDPRSGRWLVTRRGGQFLRGEISVPAQVRIQRGRVVGHSDEAVLYRDFANKSPEWNVLPDFDPDFPERKVGDRTMAMPF